MTLRVPGKECDYLHGVLLPVDGVLRARTPVSAPVQVKLDRLVTVAQASTGDDAQVRNVHLDWNIKVSCGTQGGWGAVAGGSLWVQWIRPSPEWPLFLMVPLKSCW